MLRGMLEQQRGFRAAQLAELEFASSRQSGTRREVLQTLTEGAGAALEDVRNALLRMDAGNYGRCIYCGTRLPLERLEILPAVALCMPCQQVQDALR